MDFSTKISERMWNLPDKGELEAEREKTFIDDIVQKAHIERGETPWSISYHFMPQELEGLLKKFGVKNISLAGPGAFARTIPNEILVKIMNDPAQKKEFLEFCHMYDSSPYVCGMGKDNLFAKGDKL